MRRTLAVAGLATVALALGLQAPAGPSAPAPAGPAYLDPHASIASRVTDLLGRMTLQEKAGQMDQIVVGKLRGDCNGANGALVPSCLHDVLVTAATGSILAGGTDNPVDNSGFGWAQQYDAIQQYAISNSRLHIPIIFGVDAVHGFGHPYQATLFPQQIGLGATWDTALVQAAGAATRSQVLASGPDWDFAPVQDVARDNRWGRYYETWSESKVLSGTLGAANVTGLQGGTPGAPQMAASVKHFAGYSESVNGHDRVQEELSVRYLQDAFLPSYAGGIAAGARTVMVNSGSVDGIPATASHFLLTDELRGRLGFDGVVISDYGDVPALASTYHIAADLPHAVALGVNAGVDMAMEPSDYAGWDAAVVQDVHDGLIPMARVDQAVRRILTLKFTLGLFDHPYVDPNLANAAVTGNRDLSRQAADESTVLLRNEGNVLPLSRSLGKIVVTGPAADSVTDQLGGWSVSWQGVYGAGQACCAGPPDQIPPATTVLKGIQQAVAPSTQVVYAPGKGKALAAAGSADAVVAVVGEGPYAEGLGDNPTPRLSPDQLDLLQALSRTGKPVVVVVVAGRPLGLGAGASANAVLMAWQGSTEAGLGVADVLFGAYNPSGRLPVTWPSDAPATQSNFNPSGPTPAGDEPKFYDQLPGTYSGWGSGYNPLFPFAAGLSYTSWTTSGLAVSPSRVTPDGTVTVRVTVTNTGGRAGTDVVPVYVGQPVSGVPPVVQPPRELAGFARVTLAAGQSQTAQVSVPLAPALARTPGDVPSTALPVVAPGAYTVSVDTQAATVTVG